MPYKQSLAWVKTHQPERDLRDPHTLESEAIRSLKTKIKEHLQDKDHVLRFYTAVNSSLDVFHGVDGFFELGDQIVTIDLTLNTDKVAKLMLSSMAMRLKD